MQWYTCNKNYSCCDGQCSHDHPSQSSRLYLHNCQTLGKSIAMCESQNRHLTTVLYIVTIIRLADLSRSHAKKRLGRHWRGSGRKKKVFPPSQSFDALGTRKTVLAGSPPPPPTLVRAVLFLFTFVLEHYKRREIGRWNRLTLDVYFFFPFRLLGTSSFSLSYLSTDFGTSKTQSWEDEM